MGEDDGGNDISEVLDNLKNKVEEMGTRNRGILEKGINAIDKAKGSMKKKVAAIRSAQEMIVEELIE